MKVSGYNVCFWVLPFNMWRNSSQDRQPRQQDCRIPRNLHDIAECAGVDHETITADMK